MMVSITVLFLKTKKKIEITDENMVCDFTGTHEQLKGPLNLSQLVLRQQ
jgi:N-methylhydantoinase B/oxoprolinase/acetone carboxylase alpha subunit